MAAILCADKGRRSLCCSISVFWKGESIMTELQRYSNPTGYFLTCLHSYRRTRTHAHEHYQRTSAFPMRKCSVRPNWRCREAAMLSRFELSRFSVERMLHNKNKVYNTGSQTKFLLTIKYERTLSSTTRVPFFNVITSNKAHLLSNSKGAG